MAGTKKAAVHYFSPCTTCVELYANNPYKPACKRGRYAKIRNNCHDKKRGSSSIPLFLWEDEAGIKSAKAELDKTRGHDREGKAATVMKLANNIIEMIGARHSMLADAAAKGQAIDEDTELNKLLEERTAALGDKEEDTSDAENAADAASGKGETTQPPADAPASAPTTSEATAASLSWGL
ncbi:hypothetical protein KEM55_009048 [Ascosphaera atra]|nr:hypothetical protein KEM55_009048 [Ascosphaera atra]